MKEKKKDKNLIIVIIAVIIYGLFTIVPGILMIGFIVFTDIFDSANYTVKSDGTIDVDGDLIIKNDVKGYYDDSTKTYYVEGYLVNNDDDEVEFIDIEYSVYDIDGNVLGSADAYLDKLDKGGIWKFKARYDDIDANLVDSYKISSIDY